ncbi:cysteine-rich receptor-like protein kinase 10 [Miscanthus floridulus]|uniref:cysteine-rich receptor-like protein kinase 10 n=1 Tax=Miscanthus floridulus TaxID=154761 RepID=UPI00345788A5
MAGERGTQPTGHGLRIREHRGIAGVHATSAMPRRRPEERAEAAVAMAGDAELSGACVNNSFAYAQKMCPYAKAASVYDDDCLVGFSSSNILVPANNITRDMSTLFQYWNPTSITGDATVVAADVNYLLTQTARVAAATSPRRFATAFMDASSSSIPTLYSLAQCTPDLSADDCLACLQRIVGVVNATTSVLLGGRVLVLRCNFRFENMMFYEGAPMMRITPSSSGPPASPFPAPTTNKRPAGMKPWVIAVSVTPPLAVVALCFIFYCRWRRRRYRKGRPRLRRKSTHISLRGGEEPDWEMEAFSVFDFHQILEATNKFSEENKLGEGGFGPVYKGQFPEGAEIAVKRLASHSGQGFIEFKNEVQLIAKLQHTNLVRLLGCCSQEEEKILVYEYLPNKSLDFLSLVRIVVFNLDEDRKSLLDWNKCLAIIEGTVEGLLYLHKHSRLRVIHRDLKPSNILLDSEMNPKISDFRLAKIFSSNNNEGSTTRRVVGTYGYMAPEYASEGLFSVKSDVFSFGVLILEIISGKRNSGIHDCGDFINILGYTWQLYEEGRWRELVDASLLSMHHSDEMIMRCMNIGLLCVQENAVDRPTMLDVVAMLSSKTKILAKPNHPAYFNVQGRAQQHMHSALQLVLMSRDSPLANCQSIAGGMACASVQISSINIQLI